MSPRWLQWEQAVGGSRGGRGGQDGLSQSGRTHTSRGGHRRVLRVQGECVCAHAASLLTWTSVHVSVAFSTNIIISSFLSLTK